jgi:hypothetical protein
MLTASVETSSAIEGVTVRSRSNSKGKPLHTYKVKANGKAATGRSTKYDERFLPMVFELARHGATYQDIAHAFNVSEGSVKLWVRDNDEFLAAYKKGKDEHDTGRVESALLKRALGYDYTERSTKSTTLRLGRGQERVAVPAEEVTVSEKKMAPDIGAAIFWLTNRQRLRWQNTRYTKNEVDVTTINKVVHEFTDLPEDELESLHATLTKALKAKHKQPAAVNSPAGNA